MSHFPVIRRASFAALGLSLLLLADGLMLPSDGVEAADKAPAVGRITSATVESGEAIACAQGFVQIDSKVNMSLHGVARTDWGSVAVGYMRRSSPGHSGIRVPATLFNRGGTWNRVGASGPGSEDGLMAVAWRKGSATWAVGFTTLGPDVKPLAMRWNGKMWQVDRPRVNGSVAVLTDVTMVDRKTPFAVGYRMDRSGRRKPLVLRKDGPRWRSTPMTVPALSSLTLTGVAPDGRRGTWVVGHGGSGAEVKPAVYKRDNGRWVRYPLPALPGEAVLTDIVATSGNESWAVGYHKRTGRSKALVLRWNRKSNTFRKVKAPTWASPDVVLHAVSVDPAGGVWVVGAAWNDELKSHEAIAAWWDGRAWNEVMSRSGGTELHDAMGSLSGSGWAVGRSDGSGRAVRVCTPPQAGLFGSSDPLVGGSSVDEEEPSLLDLTSDELLESETDDFEEGSEVADPRPRNDNRRKGKRARRVKGRIGTLPAAVAHKSIEARDVAVPAGVFEDTGTYDAVVDDFDGDGLDDLFIGRHGRSGRLLLNRGGVFVDHPALVMDPVDRHGCTSADVDGSGLPDLYCTVGGKRGSGLKSNELWLDPGGPRPMEVAARLGLADSTGRGRLAAFLDARRPRRVDLLVANTPTRVDGLPSLGRYFRSTGSGTFRLKGSPGIAPRIGARALQDADFDGDGREDLLLVAGGPQSPSPGGVRLYRNTSKGLVDVTRKMGIRAFDEVDAELVDLNRDGRLDLVQLGERKIKVSLQKRGRFKKVFERNLTDGRAIASGDVNGDGRGDLYLMRSANGRNSPDVLLVNRRDGRRWSSMVVPQVSSGSGDDAYAIDHDGNGLDDFLVLNGHNLRGPTQLIAFYRR